MGRRRKKDPPPEEKVSAAWEQYRPGRDALYWKFGGPFIPVDQIEPTEDQVHQNRPEWLARHIKQEHLQIAYVAKELDRSRTELAEHIRWYLLYEREGIDALQYEWLKESDRNLAKDPQAWLHTPSNLDQRKASAFAQIGYWKARVASCEARLEQLERPAFPLFHLGG